MLHITTFWDGTPCENPLLHGTVSLQATAPGLRITATLPHQPQPRVPQAEALSRVANLWEYDVVECFLVGEEKYLEVELGAGGHFLVLDFSAPRIRANEYADFSPDMEYRADAGDGRWSSSIVIPWHMVPKGVKAMNAFVIVGEQYLCLSPLPGPKPDFHQPDRFPKNMQVLHVLAQFPLPPLLQVDKAGSGLLNSTYRITTEGGDFALQQLHPVIPDAAIEDMRVVTAHLAAQGMRVPQLVATTAGTWWYRAEDGARWRVYPWIDGVVVDAVADAHMAREAGQLLGRMHRHLAALAYRPQGSIPHFHDTAFILEELRAVGDQLPPELHAMRDDILATLPALITNEERQTIHADCKISNLVFDTAGNAVGVIDFDTLLWQSRAIDLGDAYRSWCNRTAEDDDRAVFDEPLFRAAEEGYAEGWGAPQTAQDTSVHLRATKQIALELASRFLIDVVRDNYFGFDATKYDSRRAANIARARGQYHLATTIPLV